MRGLIEDQAQVMSVVNWLNKILSKKMKAKVDRRRLSEEPVTLIMKSAVTLVDMKAEE